MQDFLVVEPCYKRFVCAEEVILASLCSGDDSSYIVFQLLQILLWAGFLHIAQ